MSSCVQSMRDVGAFLGEIVGSPVVSARNSLGG